MTRAKPAMFRCCTVCGGEFQARTSAQTICSDSECRRRAQNLRAIRRRALISLLRICLVCEEEFHPSGPQKSCSAKCARILTLSRVSRKTKRCVVCDTVFSSADRGRSMGRASLDSRLTFGRAITCSEACGKIRHNERHTIVIAKYHGTDRYKQAQALRVEKRKATRHAKIPERTCYVCHGVFWTPRSQQPTCGEVKCVKEHRRLRSNLHSRISRDRHPERHRELVRHTAAKRAAALRALRDLELNLAQLAPQPPSEGVLP